MPELLQASTTDLLHELQRRFAVLSRPEKSVLIASPDAAQIAEAMKSHFGTCVIGPSEGSTDPLPVRLQTISALLASPQCRRGFTVYGLQTKEEVEGFDRMLNQDYPGKSYSVIGWKNQQEFFGKKVFGVDKEKEITGQLEKL